MSDKAREVFFFIFAGAALIGFMLVYYQLFTGSWSPGNPPGQNFTYLAEGLTGLVGGIVATSFGQTPPGHGAAVGTWARFRARLRGAGAFLGPFDSDSSKQWLAAIYTLAYAACAIGAIVLFVQDSDDTPALVDTLATVSFGLGLSIVSGGFRAA